MEEKAKKELTVKGLLKALLVVLLILVSGVDSGYELLKDECDGATVAEGFNGNNTDLNEVTNWLKSQGYIND